MRLLVLFVLSLFVSVSGFAESCLTPEKIAACRSIGFKKTKRLNDCLYSRATPEVISSCGNLRTNNANDFFGCITYNDHELIDTCNTINYERIGHGWQTQYNACMRIAPSAEVAALCLSVGYRRPQDLHQCFRKEKAREKRENRSCKKQ